MIGSDYYLTFLERSALSDAFLTLFAARRVRGEHLLR